jgi:hypothetical protein
MTVIDMAALNCVRYALREYPYAQMGLTPDQIKRVTRFGDHSTEDREWEYDMAAVALLTDGTWASIEGGTGCETGWSCQASLHVDIHHTEEGAWLGITVDGRAMIERQEAGS